MKRLKGENVQISVWALYGLRQVKYDFHYFSPNNTYALCRYIKKYIWSFLMSLKFYLKAV